MDHFAGLDVSVKETSVCIVDDTGRIVREVKVASEPEALLPVLKNPTYHFARVIHNADTCLLDRNVQSSKMVHAALLLLMLEAVTTDLVSPSA